MRARQARGHGLYGSPSRERWSWTAWPSAVTVGVLGVVAVCVVVSAITVVSRQPFGDTGVVLPTVPVTTATAPPPSPSSAAPIPSPARGPPRLRRRATYPSIVPPTSPASAPPPPPKPSSTHPSSSRSAPSSVHPTTHQPFPQETTDFLGPPGTNNLGVHHGRSGLRSGMRQLLIGGVEALLASCRSRRRCRYRRPAGRWVTPRAHRQWCCSRTRQGVVTAAVSPTPPAPRSRRCGRPAPWWRRSRR